MLAASSVDVMSDSSGSEEELNASCMSIETEGFSGAMRQEALEALLALYRLAEGSEDRLVSACADEDGQLRLAPVEHLLRQMLVEVAPLGELRARAQLVLSVLRFPLEAEVLEAQLRTGISAVHTITDSWAMPLLLEGMLILGNFVNNCSRSLGAAHGVSLDSLGKLAHTRCLQTAERSPGGSLHCDNALSLIVQQLQDVQGPSFLSALVSDLEGCRRARDLEAASLEASLQALEAQVRAMDERLRPSSDGSPPLLRAGRLRRFLAKAEPRIEQLRELMQGLNSETQRLRKYFAEPPGSSLGEMLHSLVELFDMLPKMPPRTDSATLRCSWPQAADRRPPARTIAPIGRHTDPGPPRTGAVASASLAAKAPPLSRPLIPSLPLPRLQLGPAAAAPAGASSRGAGPPPMAAAPLREKQLPSPHPGCAAVDDAEDQNASVLEVAIYTPRTYGTPATPGREHQGSLLGAGNASGRQPPALTPRSPTKQPMPRAAASPMRPGISAQAENHLPNLLGQSLFGVRASMPPSWDDTATGEEDDPEVLDWVCSPVGSPGLHCQTPHWARLRAALSATRAFNSMLAEKGPPGVVGAAAVGGGSCSRPAVTAPGALAEEAGMDTPAEEEERGAKEAGCVDTAHCASFGSLLAPSAGWSLTTAFEEYFEADSQPDSPRSVFSISSAPSQGSSVARLFGQGWAATSSSSASELRPALDPRLMRLGRTVSWLEEDEPLLEEEDDANAAAVA